MSLMRPCHLGVLLVILALFTAEAALAQNAGAAEEISAARQRLDKAFQDHDAATIRAMMTEDHQSITSIYGKDMNVSEQMETLDSYVFDFVNSGEERLVFLSEDAALMNFETLYAVTFEGEPLPDRVLVTEIWVKVDGAWLQRLYQETPVPKE